MEKRRKDWALSHAEKMDARRGLELIGERGISLEECVRIALQIKGDGPAKAATVAEAVEAFLLDRLRTTRPKTYGWYEQHLRAFEVGESDRRLDEVDAGFLRTYIPAVGGGRHNKAGRWRAIRAMLKWAVRADPPMVAHFPAEGYTTDGNRRERSGRSERIEFLTVDECEAIMADPGPYAATLALLLFAGVRPEEVAGKDKPPMLWGQVDFRTREIRIEADQSKTDMARVIGPLPANLWQWLRAHRGKADERICPYRSRQAIMRAQRQVKRKWPHDATRHTFTSYHVACFSDLTATSLILGHEGDLKMLHRHYRGVARYEDGKRFFAIAPPG